MNMINKVLSKIGAPIWKLVQTSKHNHIGAAVILVIGAAVFIWFTL